MTDKLHSYVEKLKKKNDAWVVSVVEGHGEMTVTVPRESIVEVCAFLKEKHGFDMLADLCDIMIDKLPVALGTGDERLRFDPALADA